MSIEAIRCPGCHELVEVGKLEEHYKNGEHKAGVVGGASTITTANPHHEIIPEWAKPLLANTTHPKPGKPHLFDNPVWGPLIRRFFPHILFGAFVLGAIVGVILW